MLGFAGRAFGDTKPKFVYVANSGGDGADFYETFHFTATAVCISVTCASLVSISGTFTLNLSNGFAVNGSMSVSDPAGLNSTPVVLPLTLLVQFPPDQGLIFGQFGSGGNNGLSLPNVSLFFPFSSFPNGYSGGPLCATPLTSNCGTSSVAQFASSGGAITGTITSGAVTLTGTSGPLQGTGGVSGYAIDSTTGALAPVPGSPFAAGLGPHSAAVDPSNRFVFVANAISNNVSAFAVDSSTGALSPVPGSPFAAGLGPFSVVVDPSDRFVYVVNKDSNNVSAYTLNKTTGALTVVSASPFPAGTGPIFVTMDPKGRFVYVTNGTPEKHETLSEYRIDNATGALNPAPDRLSQMGQNRTSKIPLRRSWTLRASFYTTFLNMKRETS